MRFADEVSIKAIAGKGGDGCLSFHRSRSQPKGGPDGGDGGKGGDVVLRADGRLTSLQDLHNRTMYRAENGASGQGNLRTGSSGQPLEVLVPCGTMVYAAETDELIADLTENDQRVVVAKGGLHGFGNTHFRSSTNRAPRRTTNGKPGEERTLRLQLHLLADAGLLGQPNAGKSTLLACLSEAKPKTGAFPFTTLKPGLGVIQTIYGDRMTIADIPGLIAGAADGKGLGHRFLRHLARTRLLLQIVDAAAPDPAEAVRETVRELEQYDPELSRRRRWLIVNKMDLISDENREKFCASLVKSLRWEAPWFAISALDGTGLEQLRAALLQEAERIHHSAEAPRE